MQKSDKEDSETMVSCTACEVYISVGESVIKEGKHYCSKECAQIS